MKINDLKITTGVAIIGIILLLLPERKKPKLNGYPRNSIDEGH